MLFNIAEVKLLFSEMLIAIPFQSDALLLNTGARFGETPEW